MDEEEKKQDPPSWQHPGNQPDVYVRCPYFPEHELRQSRLPYHLPKCQSNPRAPKLLVCPYNFMHRIRSEDRAEHLLVCEDRPGVRFHDRAAPSYKSTTKMFNETKMPVYRSYQIVETHSAPQTVYRDIETPEEEYW